MPKQQNPIRQVVGAVADMTRNYFDMKRDNTVGADDYFHCKANYEAADRGDWGRSTATWLGNKKKTLIIIETKSEDFLRWKRLLIKFTIEK